jgi:hypothetical protein
MFEEPLQLEDRLHELAEEWQSYCLAYREHVVDLLNRFWAFGSDAAGVDLGAGADLLIHCAQLVTMEGFVDSLLGVLEAHDDARVTQYANRPQPPSGSGSAET